MYEAGGFIGDDYSIVGEGEGEDEGEDEDFYRAAFNHELLELLETFARYT